MPPQVATISLHILWHSFPKGLSKLLSFVSSTFFPTPQKPLFDKVVRNFYVPIFIFLSLSTAFFTPAHTFLFQTFSIWFSGRHSFSDFFLSLLMPFSFSCAGWSSSPWLSLAQHRQDSVLEPTLILKVPTVHDSSSSHKILAQDYCLLCEMQNRPIISASSLVFLRRKVSRTLLCSSHIFSSWEVGQSDFSHSFDFSF